MKKYLLRAIILCWACHSFGQGTVLFSNYVPGILKAPIYGPETSDHTIARLGNTSAGIPTGIQVYTGDPLSGINYSVSLYAGPSGSAEGFLVAVATTGFLTGSSAGLFNGGSVAIPGVAEGQVANLQIRAWDNAGGTISSYEQTLGIDSIARGKSTLLSVQLGGISGQAYLYGLQSFNIATVPEPSTAVFGVMGLLGLILARRR